MASMDCSDKKELGRALFAEFIGMTLFIFAGCGTVVSSGSWNRDDQYENNTSRLMPIAMSFGLGIVVLLYCIGTISGGHLNPAVSLFLMLLKKTTPMRAFLYIASQFLGALFGALLLLLCTVDAGYGQPAFYLGANSLVSNMTSGQGLLLETIGTIFLCLTVFFTEVRTDGPAKGQPSLSLLCVGLSVFLVHCVLVPFTGCGINPARTFGPAFVGLFAAGNDGDDVFFGPDVWIYYIGPVLGAFISYGCALVFGESDIDVRAMLLNSPSPPNSPSSSSSVL